MKPARLALALALCCIVLATNGAEPAAPIKLEGILVAGEFYGPPDYGEDPQSDRVEHSLFLQLPAQPATQVADSAALASLALDAQSTYFVQVVIHDPDHLVAERAIGHKVQVVGVPFAPLTGHHRTPLLIDVRSLTPIESWGW